MDAVLKTAAKEGKAVELNASVDRLDLSDIHLKRAKELGVRVSVGSDAHSIQGLSYHYGIAQARRGWLEESDIVNCLPFAEFERWRKARRKG
jgi:DNA polymerase (family 10)